MLKIFLGAVIGCGLGYTGGPVWMLAGAGLGALAGFIVNMELAVMSLIFKGIRYVVLFTLTLVALNWLIAKYLHISIWDRILSQHGQRHGPSRQ